MRDPEKKQAQGAENPQDEPAVDRPLRTPVRKRLRWVDDPEILDRLEQAIVAGNTVRVACALVGVSYESYMVLYQRGAKSKTRNAYRRFYERMSEAEAKAIHRNVMLVQKAAKERWQAAAWFLERRCPDEWGPRQFIEQTGAGGGPIEMVVDTRLEECLRRAYGAVPETLLTPQGGNGSNGGNGNHRIQ
jgi:hypothetical protein